MTKPILGFQGEYRWLSNFWPCEVWFQGIKFPSVEHAYVAAKSLDPKVHQAIASMSKPGEVKRFGRSIDIRPGWDNVKLEIMYDLVLQKFLEEPLRSKLLDTGNAYIEETNAWNDTFWGVNHEGIGYNHLGTIIMKVREELSDSGTY